MSRIIYLTLVVYCLFSLVLAGKGFQVVNQARAGLDYAGLINSQTVAEYKAAKGCTE